MPDSEPMDCAVLNSESFTMRNGYRYLFIRILTGRVQSLTRLLKDHFYNSQLTGWDRMKDTVRYTLMHK